MELFKSELKGVEIQRNCNLNRETYLQIAEEKGGRTALVIGVIIGLDNEKDSMELGALIQLVDDFIDLKDDENLGIFTLARYDFEKGNMDKYIHYTMKKIDDLTPVYNFFKPILMTGLILGVHDNKGCVSEELNEILSNYNHFTNNTSKDSMNDWFHEQLYKYVN